MKLKLAQKYTSFTVSLGAGFTLTTEILASELRHALSVTCIPDFKHLNGKKKCQVFYE